MRISLIALVLASASTFAIPATSQAQNVGTVRVAYFPVAAPQVVPVQHAVSVNLGGSPIAINDTGKFVPTFTSKVDLASHSTDATAPKSLMPVEMPHAQAPVIDSPQATLIIPTRYR